MSPRYFQGTSILGPVKASAARTFRDVVDTLRICPTLGMTRHAFLSLPKKERNEKKQVPFFVACCFTESPSERITRDATSCNLLFLDIDELPNGNCPAAPFVSNPDSLHTALGNLNFAAHTTASSNPDKPRMRIVVDAADIPLPQYPQAVASIAAMLGLVHITKESKVAVQPMFLPTLFQDSSEEEHPLIAHRVDGRAFTTADITTPDSPASPQSRQHGEQGIDALQFLRAPVPEITLAVAKEALSHLDPDCSYYDWLECAAALRHQFSPHRADEAYELFDEWSATGDKYGTPDDTKAKWDSIRQTPIGRAPITIRSLLRQAVASGWDDKRIKETCFNQLLTWTETVATATELMEQGVHKILATPLLSAVQEDVLVHQLCRQAKSRFACTISATAIRKDIARTKAEIKAQEKTAEKVREPLWAKGVCYLSAANEFYRHRTGEKYKSESFNASYSRHLLPSEDSLKDAGIPVTPATLSKPIVSPHDYALNHLKITTAYDYAYDPSQPTEVFFIQRGRKYVNTYTPTYPELDPAHASAVGDAFQRHLCHLVTEPEYRRILIDYLAFMVQCPGQKIRWAMLLQSVEGAGKTYLAKVMQAVLGYEHVKILADGAIKSGYNEWSFGHQLVVLEEVRVIGVNRHEIMNALKPLITNDDISVNEKFRSQRQVQNISNYIAFSNFQDALALTPGDRRWFVIKSPLQSKAQVLSLGENYFPPLYAMLRDHPGAMRSWLADWSISTDFRADGHAPRTRYVQELINDTANDLTAAIRRLLLEGDHPLIQYDITSAKQLLDTLHIEENLGRATAQQVAQVLREEGFSQLGRHLFGMERHYVWARAGVDKDNAVDQIAKRFKENKKNLCMELLFT